MEIVTPTESDMSRIATIGLDSYENQPMARLLFAHPPSNEVRKYFEDITKQGWNSMLRRAVRDTATGELVSFAAYSFVPADNSDLWKQPPPKTQPPENVINGEQMAKLHLEQHEKRVKHMGPTAFLYLHQVATDPKAGRRGAGSMLMKYLNEVADKYNLPMFLVSTPQGRGLYARYGFEEKETFEYDLSSINEPSRKSWVMIRPAARPGAPHVVPSQPLRPIRVEPVEPTMDACRDMETCTDEAFNSEPLIELCFFGAEHETLDERAAHLFDHVKRPDEYLLEKAVDPDTGKALGYAKWMLAADPHKKMYAFARDWPRGCNVACAEAVFGNLTRRREQYFKDNNIPYAYMASLMIRPGAQRRGVGSALLRSGLKRLDERGWKAWIDASPSGAGLYRKFGWKDQVTISVNLKDYGGPDHTETVLGLLRDVDAKEVPRTEVAV